jgi:hypothetical protein
MKSHVHNVIDVSLCPLGPLGSLEGRLSGMAIRLLLSMAERGARRLTHLVCKDSLYYAYQQCTTKGFGYINRWVGVPNVTGMPEKRRSCVDPSY